MTVILYIYYLVITVTISLTDIKAMVTLDFGWKHITRHVP